MPDGNYAMKMVPAGEAIDFMKRAFMAVGMPEADAATTAARMADADLMGKDSHGIFRLPGYIGRIRQGGINLTPDIRIERETSATALVDGDNGMGHLVVSRCAEIAMDKEIVLRLAGCAFVGFPPMNRQSIIESLGINPFSVTNLRQLAASAA